MITSINTLFTKYGKRRFITTVAIVAAVVLIGFYFLTKGGTQEEAAVVSLPQVRVASVAELGSEDEFSSVGTVSAVSEARLQTESGGRITSVNATIGDRVAAGQVLATIENAAQRAALLQAQGSYEAAVAGAQQSNSGSRDAATALNSAEEAAVQAVRNAFTDVNAALINTVDPFFSSPQTSVPGLRVSGDVTFLSGERVAFQTIMPSWQTSVAKDGSATLPGRLDEAEKNTARMIAFVDALTETTNAARESDTMLGQPVKSYTAGLLTESAKLNATLRSIQVARTGLTSAKEGVARAEIAATGGSVSLADAQVKIALGSLRSAQAAYEKTLVRTPIAGVVNAFYLKAGEYVSPSAPAAIVANNNGLEITTSVSQEDSAVLAVGDRVTIDATASGTITAIAGAVDPTTGKVAVKISVPENTTLQNGSTVSISFVKVARDAAPTTITIPLSAVKMTGSGPVAFFVNEENKLTTQALVLGPVSGESVVVTEGLSLDSHIVVDARGRKEGEEVVLSK
jgi:RND family efflux transporter MFP subunit